MFLSLCLVTSARISLPAENRHCVDVKSGMIFGDMLGYYMQASFNTNTGFIDSSYQLFCCMAKDKSVQTGRVQFPCWSATLTKPETYNVFEVYRVRNLNLNLFAKFMAALSIFIHHNFSSPLTCFKSKNALHFFQHLK